VKGDISTIPVFPVLKPDSHSSPELERQIHALHERIDQILQTIKRKDAEAPPSAPQGLLGRSLGALKSLWPLLTILLVASVASSLLLVRAYGPGLIRHPPAIGSAGNIPLIAIQTDYGSKSYYMGALMGVIYKRNPQARVQVITSEIENFDRLDAAWTLWQASRYYPEGTIFVVITNPGGLTSSPPTVITTNNGFIFIGHDNGCFDLVVQHYGHKASYPISSPELSPTQFKDGGLDYFGPTAAALSLGFSLEKVGPKSTNYSPKLPDIKHSVSADKIVGTVIAVDKFGNANTNISEEDIKSIGLRNGEQIELVAGTAKIRVQYEDTYSRVAVGQPVAIINDSQLQLAIREGNFAEKYKIKRGSVLTVNILKALRS
jgi:S-adenosylmethionine hydrolase